MTAKINTKKPKVLMFIQNSRWLGRKTNLMVPHSFLLLTTILRDDFDLSYVDANGHELDEQETTSRLKTVNPDAVLISAISAVQYPGQTHYAIELIRKTLPDTVIVLGGVYPTVSAEDAVKDENIDYIFIGHAEERVVDFLHRALKKDQDLLRDTPGVGFIDRETGEPVVNRIHTKIGDVKEMVKPDYSLVDIEPYLYDAQELSHLETIYRNPVRLAPMITSYGCPYDCSFCAIRTISGRKMAYRPLEDVYEEIDFLVEKYNVSIIRFYDDNFVLKRDRVISICNEFKSGRWPGLRWKTAGLSVWLLDDELLEILADAKCEVIHISVETGSQRVMDKLVRKPIDLEKVPPLMHKCKELGISTRGQFVIGFPGETWEEIRQTFAFAEICDFTLSHFAIATPLPHTDLFHWAVQQNVLADDFHFDHPGFEGWNDGFIETDEFSRNELKILRAFEWDRINFCTEEKRKVAAKVMDMTVEQLDIHRRKTRERALNTMIPSVTETPVNEPHASVTQLRYGVP